MVASDPSEETVSDLFGLKVEDPDNISELSSKHFTVHPNPTSGVVYIQFIQALNKDMNYEILDVSGIKIIQGELIKGDINFSINLFGYKHGYYLLKVYTEKNQVIKKIILQ